MNNQIPEEDYEIKLKQAEIDKLEAESRALSQSHFSKPSNWLPLLVAAGGIITALAQCQTSELRIQKATLKSQQEALSAERAKFDLQKQLRDANKQLTNAESSLLQAKEEKDTADSQKEALEIQIIKQESRRKRQQELLARLEKQIEEKRILLAQIEQPDEVKEIDRKIAETVSELKSPEIVYVQFRGSLKRELMNDLMKSFDDQGMPVPGVERVAGEYGNSVRYFHESDRESAEKVKRSAIDFFAAKDCPISEIEFLDLSKSEFKVKEGQLELWIHHSCK